MQVSTHQSISDDDLCSECLHCTYRPGELSECKLGWPGDFHADDYIRVCGFFVQVTIQD